MTFSELQMAMGEGGSKKDEKGEIKEKTKKDFLKTSQFLNL